MYGEYFQYTSNLCRCSVLFCIFWVKLVTSIKRALNYQILKYFPESFSQENGSGAASSREDCASAERASVDAQN